MVIKLADSIIAATALARNFPLVTVNENDFKKIKELTIINPLKFPRLVHNISL